MAASTDRPGNTNAAEALAMKHALTAVRFVTGDDMLAGTVSKITLKDVYGTGRLPLQASAAWYDLGGTTSFAQTFSPEAVAPDPQVPDTPLTPEAATFMMLPQTLPAGAQIEVVYTDKLTSTLRTLTADIAGSTWPMGKTVTYRISTSSIVVTPTLAVTAPADFEHTGGTQGYTVTSYATVTEGGSSQTLNAAWTAEFSDDGGASWSGTKPSWLTSFTESGAGGTSAVSYTATVAAQAAVISSPQNAALQAAAPVNDGTNANIHDLSTKGGTAAMRTANCYIVNAAGRYRLPLVYGNAVDYAKVPGTGNNASAYTSTASGTDILTTFINHLGAGITDPYIYSNAGCTPANCTLVWQDEPNLVTNVALSSDSHFLEFTVAQSTIRQGNAVVAVRDASNTVLWSWHIWVTDYKPGTGDKTITNFQSHNYTIMPVNLGWCDAPSTIYAGRTVQVRFRQTGTGATQTITVKQKAHTVTELGNSTFYQWGRKDPFVGAILDGTTTKNKTWYDASGATHTDELPATSDFATGNACITSGITLPNTFCTNSNMDNRYANLWSANNTVYTANDNPVVKTIYDPCPAGYKMPPGNAFTGFSTTGQSTINPSQVNASGAWNRGSNFHCGLNHTGDTIFFPGLGYRFFNFATLVPLGNLGFYWLALPRLSHNGWHLFFASGNVIPVNPNQRGFGFPVRPCQE
ncbi:fimbrillin family protein [Prevotella heparinolytica]|uniref:fimbrillin family protein n=1 Tax=Prevotella heparinolytica TaxID=28113 RepID=UPI001041AD00|nr:fimbrillin family protein [Bacteroides heparinolyticus]